MTAESGLGRLGEVYAWTVVKHEQASRRFRDYAPFILALVRLDSGPLILAQLTDASEEEVGIGLPVEMVTRKLSVDGDEGLIQYGYKFRPVLKV